MSEKIKMVIVQYLLMHLSIEAISSKLKHFHSYMYMISRQGLYYFIKQWRSGKGLRCTRNNSILFGIIFKDPKKIIVRLTGLWTGLNKGDYYLPGIYPTEGTSSCV